MLKFNFIMSIYFSGHFPSLVDFSEGHLRKFTEYK